MWQWRRIYSQAGPASQDGPPTASRCDEQKQEPQYASVRSSRSSSPALTHERKGAPVTGVSIPGIGRIADHVEHGPPECLGAADRGVGLQSIEGARGEAHGRL